MNYLTHTLNHKNMFEKLLLYNVVANKPKNRVKNREEVTDRDHGHLLKK